MAGPGRDKNKEPGGNRGISGTVLMVVGLVALLLAAQFTGSGSARSDSELVLWHSYLGLEQKALEKLVREYNARPGAMHIRLLQVSFDNLPQKVTNAIPRGQGPDLFIFAHDRLGDWTGKRLIEPVGFWVDPAMARRFLPGTLDAFMAKGALYGLPLTYKSVALFYNKDMVPRPPKTTDELLAMGRRLTDREKGRYGLVYQATDIYFHAPWLFGFGGRLLRRKGCGYAPDIVSNQAIAALKFARRLAGPRGIVPPEVTGQLVTTLFRSGRAAMAISGPWFLSGLAGARHLRYGVAVLPVVSQTGKPAAPLLSVEGIFMSSRCRHKQAAFAFMKYLTSRRSSALRLSMARQLPVDRDVAGKVIGRDPVLAAFVRQRQAARLTPSTPMMRVLWRPYSKALAAVIARGKDPRKALEEARWEVGKFLGSCLLAHEKGCGDRSVGSTRP